MALTKRKMMVTEAKPNTIEGRFAKGSAWTTAAKYTFGKEANKLIWSTFNKGNDVPGGKTSNLIIEFTDKGLVSGNVGQGNLIALTWKKTK